MEFETTADDGSGPQQGKTNIDFTAMDITENEYGFQNALRRLGDAQNKMTLSDISQANEETDATAGLLDNAINKVAFTITTAKVVGSVNGGEILSLAFGGISEDTVTMYLGFSGELDIRLRSFTFQEAVEDAALPALSAL
jgi:hypothetical protein